MIHVSREALQRQKKAIYLVVAARYVSEKSRIQSTTCDAVRP